jgi:hypothetical protein
MVSQATKKTVRPNGGLSAILSRVMPANPEALANHSKTRLLVRTEAVEANSKIAIMTENPVAMWEVVAFEPDVKSVAIFKESKFPAMGIPTSVDVVNSKELVMTHPTASALYHAVTVVIQHLHAKSDGMRLTRLGFAFFISQPPRIVCRLATRLAVRMESIFCSLVTIKELRRQWERLLTSRAGFLRYIRFSHVVNVPIIDSVVRLVRERPSLVQAVSILSQKLTWLAESLVVDEGRLTLATVSRQERQQPHCVLAKPELQQALITQLRQCVQVVSQAAFYHEPALLRRINYDGLRAR